MDALSAFSLLFVLAVLRYLPVMLLPGFSPLSWAPPQVRIVVLLAFAWLTVLSLPTGQMVTHEWSIGIVFAMCSELVLGMTLGLAFMLPNAALHGAGWMVDMQAGLGAATLLNPSTNSEPESLLGHALMLAATVLFFLLDLHIQLFKTIATSTRVLPLGQGGFQPNVEAFLGILGTCFALGITVVAPVVIGLFCVDFGIAYASRAMPQANIYFLALPLKVAVALGLMALTLAYAPALMGRLFDAALQQAPAVLGGPP